MKLSFICESNIERSLLELNFAQVAVKQHQKINKPKHFVNKIVLGTVFC